MKDFKMIPSYSVESYVNIFTERKGECDVLLLSGTAYFEMRDYTKKHTDDMSLMVKYCVDTPCFITSEEFKRIEELSKTYNRAKVILARCYWDGFFVEKDINKAVEILTEAALGGNAIAANNLGVIFCDPNYEKFDYAKSFECFKISAELNYRIGQFNLGQCYHYGWGVEKDLDLAIKYYSLAKNQDFHDGDAYLGDIYVEKGMNDRAVSCYLDGYNAKIVNADCVRKLGFCYENGVGVQKDLKKAYAFYSEGSERFNRLSYYETARCLFNGIGTKRNYSQALYYFEKAGSYAVKDAWFMAGLIYFKGKGRKVDFERAFECFKKGGKTNEPKALFCLSKCYREGLGTNPDEYLADEYYQKAVERGVDVNSINALIEI